MTHLPSWAVPGRKVVCVDDEERDVYVPGVDWVGTLDGLTKGQIYTLRCAEYDPITNEPVVHLVEITRDMDDAGESGYLVRRFRPIVTLEEDMLTFRSLVNTVPTTLTPENTHVE